MSEKESYAHKMAKEVLYKQIVEHGVIFKYENLEFKSKKMAGNYGWVLEFPTKLDNGACYYPDEFACNLRMGSGCNKERLDRFRDKNGYSICKDCPELNKEFLNGCVIPDIVALHKGNVCCIIEILHKNSSIKKYLGGGFVDIYDRDDKYLGEPYIVEVRDTSILGKLYGEDWNEVHTEIIMMHDPTWRANNGYP